MKESTASNPVERLEDKMLYLRLGVQSHLRYLSQTGVQPHIRVAQFGKLQWKRKLKRNILKHNLATRNFKPIA